MNEKFLPFIVMVVIVAIGAAYMLFLAFTWQQMQKDRGAAIAKIDTILDRIGPPAEVVTVDGD